MLFLFVLIHCQLGISSKFHGQWQAMVENPPSGVAPFLHVSIKNAAFTRTTVLESPYLLPHIPIGIYQIHVSAQGFEPVWLQGVEIVSNFTTTSTIRLTPAAVSLQEWVVAPSSFSLLEAEQPQRRFLDRETLRQLPRFGNEFMRTLDILPGTASNDITASFYLRGGSFRETKILLDDMELIDPFHLKDYAGVFSFIDTEAVGGLQLFSGGFGATHGDALSGIMEIQSKTPSEKISSAEISFGGLQVHTEGTFSDGLGHYVVSGRRGYLDLLLALAGEEEEEEGVTEDQDVRYFDSFGTLSYLFGENHRLSMHYLLAQDRFLEQEVGGPETEDIDSAYDDTYVWATLKSVLGERWTSWITLHHTDLDRDRFALSLGDESQEDFRIEDETSYQKRGIKAKCAFDSESLFLQFGGGFEDSEAMYDYSSFISNGIVIGGDSERFIDIAKEVSGHSWNAFGSARIRLSDKVVSEWGLRVDRHSWTNEAEWSPRVNVSYRIHRQTLMKLAFGLYRQAERLDELQVADGLEEFSPPEKATHAIFSLEHLFDNGISFTLEAYQKRHSDVRPRFANLTKSLVFYPGISGDRVRIDAKNSLMQGVELIAKRERADGISWMASYSFAKSEDTLEDDRTLPRPWDQKHTLKINGNAPLGQHWHLNATYIFHSGWPTTPFFLEEVDGEPTVVAGE
jgi:hypothetical protein